MVTRARRARRRTGGFTLLEVMVAVLLAMIGLMGTLAIQQTVLNATQNTNEAQIAMRLATQTLEELNARLTRPGPPVFDQLAPIAGTTWSAPVYLDSGGNVGVQSAQFRFLRQVLVWNRGTGLPYYIAVRVEYGLDSGQRKEVRIDIERSKTW